MDPFEAEPGEGVRELTTQQKFGRKITTMVLKFKHVKGPQGQEDRRSAELKKHMKTNKVKGFLDCVRQGMRNDTHLIVVFTDQEKAEAYVNDSTFAGYITIGPVDYRVSVAAKWVTLSTAEARYIPLNDLGGPSNFGFIAPVDSLVIAKEMLDDNHVWKREADIKCLLRGTASFLWTPASTTMSAQISWYPVIPGVTSEIAASKLPYIMKQRGSECVLRGKDVALFLIFKHMNLSCTACHEMGHTVNAPTCYQSATSIMGDISKGKNKARPYDPNMGERNVRPRHEQFGHIPDIPDI